MPINQYLGEAWIESNPVRDFTEMLFCLSNQEILEATIYIYLPSVSVVLQQNKVCDDH